jgi:hypothetical protein
MKDKASTCKTSPLLGETGQGRQLIESHSLARIPLPSIHGFGFSPDTEVERGIVWR